MIIKIHLYITHFNHLHSLYIYYIKLTFILASSSLSKISLIISNFISACCNFLSFTSNRYLASSKSPNAFSSCDYNCGSVWYWIIIYFYLYTSRISSLFYYTSVFTGLAVFTSVFLVSPCFKSSLAGLFTCFVLYSIFEAKLFVETGLGFSIF